MTTSARTHEAAKGGLTTFEDKEWYRIDGLSHMDPFLMTVSSNSDLWLFASSSGALTAGRVDANGAFLPYETDNRIHRAAGTQGPVTLLAMDHDGVRQLWQPFGANPTADTVRSVAKATTGNHILFEERNDAWGLLFRTIWSPADAYGWVRRTQLVDLSGAGARVEVVDGLVDVIPTGLDATFNQLMSNLADAYKRSETGRWGTAAVYTLESLISDGTMPGESLAATVVWAFGETPSELHLDERVLTAMRRGQPWNAEHILTGRRGAYLMRGTITVPPSGSKQWGLVADAGLDRAQVADRIGIVTEPHVDRLVIDSIAAGDRQLRHLLGGADGFQRTGDPTADAHHLSNVMSNSMRGGLLPFGTAIPIGSFLEHLRRWNLPTHDRFAATLQGLGDSMHIDDLRAFVDATGDADLVRLTLEFMPLAFSRRHGDPSRPWNRFSIRVRTETGEEAIGYQGNWRDIFQNWEAMLMSQPGFTPHAVAKFVNASTIDGNNPYRITHEGMDWEAPDPHDPWMSLGYWGDHQIVYLHHLVSLWERFDPGGMQAWLERPVFTYADIPYVIADHVDMVRNPRSTITYDHARATEVAQRERHLGADGRLLIAPTGEMVRVGLFEKLLVPALAKLSGFVPGGGIWMNTQKPEWNDANNALAGYGLSMVTLYYLHAYLQSLVGIVDRHDDEDIAVSMTMTRWMREIGNILTGFAPAEAAADDRTRRRFMDELGMLGDRHRRRARYSFDPTPVPIERSEIQRVLNAAIEHLRHTIEGARREDGLFDSYNLISFPSDEASSVSHLGPMLEGQVAALSSGALSSSGAADVIDALFESRMYRPDQQSFMLYPVKHLPSFLDDNTVDPADPRIAPIAGDLIAAGILVRARSGSLHFSPAMSNEVAVSDALAGTDLSADLATGVLTTYEDMFNHHAYTGRSGSMYGYEGIGSIFWHMVGKLLVAVQGAHRSAVEAGVDPAVVTRLAEAYRRVRNGLSFQKDPSTYGAIPTDWYSHSPAHAGAQQPWMTGTVKEGVIARLGELGLRIDDGRISMAPGLLATSDLVAEDGVGRFTYCGVPVTLSFGDSSSVAVERDGTWQPAEPGSVLDSSTSKEIFDRTGSVTAVRFTLSEGCDDL